MCVGFGRNASFSRFAFAAFGNILNQTVNRKANETIIAAIAARELIEKANIDTFWDG
jgi:hypothetical protein